MAWMLVVGLMPGVLAAQPAQIPRLANGKPDFQGTWRAGGTAAFDVQAHEAGYQIPAGRSVIVDPPDGKLPYRPAARLQAAKNWEQRYLDPVGYCHPHGVPRVMVPPFPVEIVQDGDTFAIFSETSHELRLIPMDGRPHRKGYVSWSGEGRGRWEGDTLLVDVTGMRGNNWLDQAGNFIGPGAHVLERLTMVSPNRIRYEATVDEPGTFERPWTMQIQLDRMPKGTEIIEYDCIEGERDVEHYQNLERQSGKPGAGKAGGKK
jgi:hypothetical protein